ncbi:hypothetical protein DCAR_0104396 [Daucus carota subsp. sativus]|uniref:F-box domain-containing protein n=1 Tax=Daucus carota subsp. sativus TaxID=79200 RepID=A0AAF0WBQ1_DAUCS|nr:PREDICTED: F-box/kelch-repeat protein At3g23880-like [Daucus carota subsp. sativus]WOG85208.1 hypothetical protein DCAR_0104396 [Daucus carota subsp. sativus]
MGQNVKKKITAAQLPEELIREEILTRLPIKSAVRFKIVSKSWLSLFSDPNFVKKHLKYNSSQNPNDYDCLVAAKHSRIVVLSRYKETFVLPSDNYEMVGSVQGLICLRRDKKLSLWNPAIHQSREFTLPTEHLERHGDLSRIGLGFDHTCNDYKVVVCYVSGDSRYGCVYSGNSDSWSDVFVPDNVFFRTKKKDWEKHGPEIIVKDCPHWTCRTYLSNNGFVRSVIVVKFEMGSNEFKLLPEFKFDASEQNRERGKHFALVTMNDCLTLMAYKPSKESVVDVYSLDEEGSFVWSKMYSVGPLDLYTHYLDLTQGFRHGGEFVCHSCGNFVCYDPKKKTVKRLAGTTSHMNLGSCFTYVPSLVYLQGMKTVHVQTQARISAATLKTRK